jgi:hypothetical protein
MPSAIKLFFTASLILVYIPINAMVSYAILKTPTNQKVEIIGDFHNLNESSASSIAQRVIATIQQNMLPQPVTILAEIPKHVEEADWLAPTMVKFLAHTSPKFTLVHADERELESDEINNIMNLMHGHIFSFFKQIGAAMHTDIVQTDIVPVPANFISSFTSRFTLRVTVGQALASQERMVKKMITFLQKYADNEKSVLLLMSKIATFLNANQLASGVLQRASGDELFGNAISKEFELDRTLVDLLSRNDLMHRIFLKQTDYLFADVCFFDKILDTLKEGKSPLIVVIGAAHVDPVLEMLATVGFELLSKKSIVEENKTGYRIKQSESPQFVEDLVNVTKKFLTPECQVCAKDGPMQSCARCKNAFYCSVECQKKAWKRHKEVCKAIKQ